VRACLWTGAGRAFTAGADFAEMAAGAAPLAVPEAVRARAVATGRGHEAGDNALVGLTLAFHDLRKVSVVLGRVTSRCDRVLYVSSCLLIPRAFCIAAVGLRGERAGRGRRRQHRSALPRRGVSLHRGPLPMALQVTTVETACAVLCCMCCPVLRVMLRIDAANDDLRVPAGPACLPAFNKLLLSFPLPQLAGDHSRAELQLHAAPRDRHAPRQAGDL